MARCGGHPALATASVYSNAHSPTLPGRAVVRIRDEPGQARFFHNFGGGAAGKRGGRRRRRRESRPRRRRSGAAAGSVIVPPVPPPRITTRFLLTARPRLTQAGDQPHARGARPARRTRTRPRSSDEADTSERPSQGVRAAPHRGRARLDDDLEPARVERSRSRPRPSAHRAPPLRPCVLLHRRRHAGGQRRGNSSCGAGPLLTTEMLRLVSDQPMLPVDHHLLPKRAGNRTGCRGEAHGPPRASAPRAATPSG